MMHHVQDVSAIFNAAPPEAPTRTCPSCGHVAATYRAECPACGKRYDRRLPWLPDRARWALAALAVVVVGLTAWAVLPGVFDERDANNARAAREQAALEEAERRRLIREQRPIAGRAPGTTRARFALVGALEAAILEDARRRVADGRLDGPVRETRCGPLTRGEDPYKDPLGRFDCVAVTSPVMQDGKEVAAFGHPYVATLDFERRTWVFCKDNKAPGERGKALASAPLDPSCLGIGPDAERVGDGYALPGD
jgi:uncharacterized Zn-finger protein